MSNSIWKTPDEIPAWCFLCVFDRPTGRSVGHYNPVKKQFCSGELRFEHKDIDKFCMINDLIAQADKAERLQKAVDLAVLRLEQGKKKFGKSKMGPNKETAMLCEIAIDEIKKLIKGE